MKGEKNDEDIVKCLQDSWPSYNKKKKCNSVVLITVNPWDIKVPAVKETPSYGILIISQSFSFIFYTGFPALPLNAFISKSA